MTRKEAKDILKAIQALICPNKESVLENNFSEAFDMAIEALIEPINCVKCKHYYETEDDTDVHGHCKMDTAHTNLISRADAVKAIRKCKFDSDMPSDWYRGMECAQDIVEELPSAEAEWIPVKTRPMDEEERREWSEKLGYDIEYDEAVIYTSQLPDDGQAVLTCNRYGNITIDIFENDPDYGCGFEENGDMDGIVAWMPLPKPYREDGE